MSDSCKCADCGRVFNWGRDADSDLVKDSSCRDNAYWKLSHHVRAEHPASLMRCPRRGESVLGGREEGDADFWRADQGCSYCGSISPAEFFAAVEGGAEIGPTDKSYKAYVDLPHPDAGKPCVLSSGNHDFGGAAIRVTPENIDELPLDDWQRNHFLETPHWVRVEPRPARRQGKFYFQHLSAEERDRFIALYNEKRMKIGYPGHFYVRPFFCAPVAERTV